MYVDWPVRKGRGDAGAGDDHLAANGGRSARYSWRSNHVFQESGNHCIYLVRHFLR